MQKITIRLHTENIDETGYVAGGKSNIYKIVRKIQNLCLYRIQFYVIAKLLRWIKIKIM